MESSFLYSSNRQRLLEFTALTSKSGMIVACFIQSLPASALSTMSEMVTDDFLEGGPAALRPSFVLSVSYHSCVGDSIDSSRDFPGSGFLEGGRKISCVTG